VSAKPPPADASAQPWRVHAVLLVIQVVFSTLPIATKLVLPVIEPLAISTLRICGSALAFAAVKWSRTTERVTAPRDLLALAGLALIGVVLNQVLFLLGVARTTAVHANILITIIPVFTLAVALALGRERLSAANFMGIVLAGSGAVYLIAGRGLGREGASAFGDSLIAINAFFYSCYLVLSKDLLRRYGPITVVTYVFLFGALLVAPVGVPALLRTDIAGLGGRQWLILAYIVAFPSFLAYLLSIWALRRTASSLVAMYVYVQPLVTALTAPLVLGERVTPRAGLAAVLIFAGLALATWGEQVAGRQLGEAYRAPAEGT
jgi:drug/metabolite transporter (DMT)-like permease